MNTTLYATSDEARASLESARHPAELRQTVASLHLQFPWQQKWEQMLTLEDSFLENTCGRDSHAYWCCCAGSSSKATPKILLDPIPLWPADRSRPSQEYVAHRIRRYGSSEFRCVVYPSFNGIPLWQSLAQRASIVRDAIHARATRLGAVRTHAMLANKALMLFKRWQRQALRSPAALWAARSVYAHLLDAPPVDTWRDYYPVMTDSIERLREFARRVTAEDRPTVLLLPFTLEPYAVTLLEAPDYPTNLLLANVFPRPPLVLGIAQSWTETPESHLPRSTSARSAFGPPAMNGHDAEDPVPDEQESDVPVAEPLAALALPVEQRADDLHLASGDSGYLLDRRWY